MLLHEDKFAARTGASGLARTSMTRCQIDIALHKESSSGPGRDGQCAPKYRIPGSTVQYNVEPGVLLPGSRPPGRPENTGPCISSNARLVGHK